MTLQWFKRRKVSFPRTEILRYATLFTRTYSRTSKSKY